MLLANLLARELAEPVAACGAAAFVGHDAGDYEGHFKCARGCCEESCKPKNGGDCYYVGREKGLGEGSGAVLMRRG